MLESNFISEDIILMFDDVYLQKREDYAGRELLTGSDPDGNLYKEIMCFMIVGLKKNVPFVVKDIPETGFNDTGWNVRLQCDPFERRYCHYRHMSGGNFLVPLREIKLFDE